MPFARPGSESGIPDGAVSDMISYAVSVARPFRRRRAIKARPEAVAMRALNPILRLRFLFDGWYNRFIH